MISELLTGGHNVYICVHLQAMESGQVSWNDSVTDVYNHLQFAVCFA